MRSAWTYTFPHRDVFTQISSLNTMGDCVSSCFRSVMAASAVEMALSLAYVARR